MISTNEFLPRLLPYVPGCPTPMAEQALVDSAIAFCEASLAIRQRFDLQRTVVGRSEFDIDPPTNQQVTRVLKVWVDGVEIPGTTADMVDDQITNASRPRTFYTLLDDEALTVHLYPTPDGVYTLAVEVALKPTRSAKTLHRDLFETWLETIVEGAKARIMVIPDQPFTHYPTAQICTLTASAGARRARVEASFGRIRGTTVVRQRPFA